MELNCVRPDISIIECLQVIDKSAAGIAVAVDNGGILIGTVSDGDIRRALLSGYTLNDTIFNIINRNSYYVSENIGRAEVLDIMQARKFNQIPIVDNQKRFIGLHLLHKLIGRINRDNWAIIMAGGKGTRLRPLTETTPKPMLKVAGRPILERLILHLISHGITKIYISVNYLAEQITDYFDDGKRFGCTIDYLLETKPLGTGGALSLLPQTINNPLLVLNGDLITQFDVGAMLDFHTSKCAAATIATNSYTHTVPFGVINSDKNDYLTNIIEKPSLSWQVNAGIYVIDPFVIKYVPPNSFFTMPEIVEKCINKNKNIATYNLDNEWIDVGRPEEFDRARGYL